MAHPREVIRKAIKQMVVDSGFDESKVFDLLGGEITRTGPYSPPLAIVNTVSEEALEDRNIPDDLAFTGSGDYILLTVEILVYVKASSDELPVDDLDDRCDKIERELPSSDHWPSASSFGTGYESGSEPFVEGVSYGSFSLEDSTEGVTDFLSAALEFSIVYNRGRFASS